MIEWRLSVGDRIYSLAYGLDFNLMIRAWEIVDSTPQHYDIQPREIPNQAAMANTKRIRKDQMCDGVFKNDYYWSKAQVIRREQKALEINISRSEDSIRTDREEYKRLTELWYTLPHYER